MRLRQLERRRLHNIYEQELSIRARLALFIRYTYKERTRLNICIMNGKVTFINKGKDIFYKESDIYLGQDIEVNVKVSLRENMAKLE